MNSQSIKNLLLFLRSNGINLRVKDNQLAVKSHKSNKIPNYILKEIRVYKNEIISYLAKNRGFFRTKNRTVTDYGLTSLITNDKLSTFINNLSHQGSISDIHALSPLQEGMLFHNLYDDNRSAYVNQFQCDIQGYISKKSFNDSWDYLVKKHTVLRTAIFSNSLDIPVQCVYDDVRVPIQWIDYSHFSGEVLQDELDKFNERDLKLGLNLETAPLLRITMIYLGDERTRMLLTNHHILIDGWAFSNLIGSFVSNYMLLEKGGSFSNLFLDNYGEHIHQLVSKNKSEGELFWKNYLSEINGPSFIPFLANDSKRNKVFANSKESLRIDADLKSYIESNKLTINTLVQGVWSYLLSRYTGESNVVFGVIISGRDSLIENIEKKVGLYINTIPLSTKINDELDISDWLQHMQNQHTLAREEYGYLSLSSIESQSNVQGSLFDTIIVFENYPVEEVLSESETETSFTIENILSEESTNYSIELTVSGSENNLAISFGYNDELISSETIQRIKTHFETLFKSIVNGAKTNEQLKYIGDREKKELLLDFNATDVVYPKDKTVLDLFRDQVAQHADHIAVVYEGEELTYRELDERSNQLARYLVGRGLLPNTIVPILLDRSLDLIVSVFGVLKSGCAYLPIDPSYPEDRIDFMLIDSDARIILTTEELVVLTDSHKAVSVICIDRDAKAIQEELNSPFSVDISLESLIYCIYTSGSTGRPKGVLVTHSNVINIVHCWGEEYDLSSKTTLLQMASFSFDVFSGDLFRSLLFGGKMIICPSSFRINPESFYSLLSEWEVSILEMTPGLAVPLFDYIYEEGYDISFLKLLILGSDLCKSSDFQNIMDRFGASMRILNSYGTTETTIDSSYYEATASSVMGSYVPIGKPLSNTTFYILDAAMNLLPIGVVGELYIGGLGVAQGYLNRPELTGERFIDNPFKAGERLYKTGDLGRWLSDGNLEFIGRDDSQVKVRGYRIELGEIESVLDALSEVKQAVVLARDDAQGGKQLVSYVVRSNDISIEELQLRLQSKLPDYMVPKRYLFLEELPLTSNGKIDRNSLPIPDASSYDRQAYVAPATDTEAQLVDIWQDLLGIDRIGVEDNFFELGGDSIKAIQLVSRSKSVDIHYKVKDVFLHQTIAAISKNLTKEHAIISEGGILAGELGLLPIQQRFFDENHQDVDHYNQSVLLTISKSVSDAVLHDTCKVLFEYHDALRLQYVYEGATLYPRQQYSNSSFTGVRSVQVASLDDIEAVCNEYQEDLAITRGDIVRFVWIQTPDDEKENRLFIGVHHLGIDGVSWRILIEDLTNLLTHAQVGKPYVLPSKGTSYRQWFSKLSDLGGLQLDSEELLYWKKVVSGYSPLQVDTEYRGSIDYRDTSSYSVVLDASFTKSLLQEVHQAYGTEINDLLLSALSISLGDVSTGSSLVIGLEGHGREELFDDVDINRTVGWFTSLFPVRLSTSQVDDLGILLSDTKDMLRSIPNKGIGYGVLRYLSDSEDVRSALSVSYDDVVFNYLGSFDNSVDKENEGIIGFASESTGASVNLKNYNPHLLSINGMIVGDCLELSWSYNSRQFTKGTIQKLADLYIDSLEAIITHCKAKSIPARTLVDYGLPALISNQKLQNFISEQENVVSDIYPLSPLQEGLLFHTLIDEHKSAYVDQLQCDITGVISKTSFEKAWRYLIEKHTVLRTAIFSDDLEVPVQCVYDKVDVPIYWKDFSEIAKDSLETEINNFIVADKEKGFVLETAPLFRITLLDIGDGITKLVFTNHHILWDGWSFSKLLVNFIEYYTILESRDELPLLQKDDYGLHIRGILSSDGFKARQFWKDYLSKISSSTFLPFVSDEKRRNKAFTNKEDKLIISEGIQSYIEQHRITANTLVQGVWSYLLSRYTGEDHVSFGAIISGRDSDIEGIEDKVGLYINTIPVCCEIREGDSVSGWLQRLQEEHTIAREEYGYLSLNTIESQSNVQGSLFDSILVFENYPVEEIAEESRPEFLISNIKGEASTNYSLSLIIFSVGDELQISFKYNDELITDEAIAVIRGHFKELLDSIIGGANTIGALNYITDKERKVLLEDFNATDVNYPKDQTVLDLFLKQVEKNPDNVAVVFGEDQLTYRELESRSNQLAHYLSDKGVENDELIPIILDRSLEMTIGILGILKSGGAYVPIDPDYPEERIQFILEDTAAKIVLTKEFLISNFKDSDLELIVLDSKETLDDLPTSRIEKTVYSGQLAYVIYTSGTTGNPKGVMMPHYILANLIFFITNLDITCQRVTQFSSISFDMSFTETFFAFSRGIELHILSSTIKSDPSELVSYIENNKIDITFLPTSFFKFLSIEGFLYKLTTIKNIIVAGEQLVLSEETINYLKKNNISLHNHYGPSETHVVTSYLINSETENRDSYVPPIGKPISNSHIYILGREMELLPVGVFGELYIGGSVVAKGYLNRDKLTSEKFIKNPFKKEDRLYKTGDIGRWLANGNIEFSGRQDDQVKIRGYRIELGEIESCLEAIEEVKQSVVLTREDGRGEKQLVAYISKSMEIEIPELQSRLQSKLPEYMIPKIYMFLDSFQLTINGKVDKKSLPIPDNSSYDRKEYVAPKTKTELKLIDIWQEILGVDKIGIKDDFFELGGHSILAIRLKVMISENLKVDIGIKDLFNFSKIEDLSIHIDSITKASDADVDLSEYEVYSL